MIIADGSGMLGFSMKNQGRILGGRLSASQTICRIPTTIFYVFLCHTDCQTS